jgi:hypothetical protein
LATEKAAITSTSKTYEEYKASIDALAASQGKQINASGQLVQKMTYQGYVTEKLIEDNYAYTKSEWDTIQAQKGMNDMVEEGIPYFGYMGQAMVDSGQAADDMAQSIKDLAAEQEALIAANLSDSLTNQLSLTLNLTDLTNDYKDKMGELATKGQELEVKLQNLKLNFPWDKEGIAQAEQDLRDNQTEIGKTADAYDLATKRIVWDMVVAELAIGGYTQAEFDWVIKSGIQMGILSADSGQLAIDLRADADKNIKSFEDQQAAIDFMHGADIYIKTYYESIGNPPPAGSWQDFSDWTPPPPGGANGGLFPANKPAIVGEKGWEMIIPNTNSLVISHADIMGALAQATLAPSFSSISAPSSYSHTVNNNFNLNLATNQSPQVVQNSFALMRVLVG